jgi:DNA-binding CsgD family transcriptional regulator
MIVADKFTPCQDIALPTDRTVRLHGGILAAGGPYLKLWYALRWLDTKGSGRLTLPAKAIADLCGLSTKTLYRHLREGRAVGAFLRYRLKKGVLTVEMGSRARLTVHLGIEDWGNTASYPIDEFLTNFYTIAATRLTAAVKQKQAYHAACQQHVKGVVPPESAIAMARERCEPGEVSKSPTVEVSSTARAGRSPGESAPRESHAESAKTEDLLSTSKSPSSEANSLIKIRCENGDQRVAHHFLDVRLQEFDGAEDISTHRDDRSPLYPRKIITPELVSFPDCAENTVDDRLSSQANIPPIHREESMENAITTASVWGFLFGKKRFSIRGKSCFFANGAVQRPPAIFFISKKKIFVTGSAKIAATSQESIAEAIGRSKKTVNRHLKAVFKRQYCQSNPKVFSQIQRQTRTGETFYDPEILAEMTPNGEKVAHLREKIVRRARLEKGRCFQFEGELGRVLGDRNAFINRQSIYDLPYIVHSTRTAKRYFRRKFNVSAVEGYSNDFRLNPERDRLCRSNPFRRGIPYRGMYEHHFEACQTLKGSDVSGIATAELASAELVSAAPPAKPVSPARGAKAAIDTLIADTESALQGLPDSKGTNALAAAREAVRAAFYRSQDGDRDSFKALIEGRIALHYFDLTEGDRQPLIEALLEIIADFTARTALFLALAPECYELSPSSATNFGLWETEGVEGCDRLLNSIDFINFFEYLISIGFCFGKELEVLASAAWNWGSRSLS